MGLMDYFTSVPSMTAQETKKFFAEKKIGEYNLIDVRQPGEYEREHIPGANLIPMAELKGRFQEIDPDKPTIVY